MTALGFPDFFACAPYLPRKEDNQRVRATFHRNQASFTDGTIRAHNLTDD